MIVFPLPPGPPQGFSPPPQTLGRGPRGERDTTSEIDGRSRHLFHLVLEHAMYRGCLEALSSIAPGPHITGAARQLVRFEHLTDAAHLGAPVCGFVSRRGSATPPTLDSICAVFPRAMRAAVQSQNRALYTATQNLTLVVPDQSTHVQSHLTLPSAEDAPATLDILTPRHTYRIDFADTGTTCQLLDERGHWDTMPDAPSNISFLWQCDRHSAPHWRAIATLVSDLPERAARRLVGNGVSADFSQTIAMLYTRFVAHAVSVTRWNMLPEAVQDSALDHLSDIAGPAIAVAESPMESAPPQVFRTLAKRWMHVCKEIERGQPADMPDLPVTSSATRLVHLNAALCKATRDATL